MYFNYIMYLNTVFKYIKKYLKQKYSNTFGGLYKIL